MAGHCKRKSDDKRISYGFLMRKCTQKIIRLLRLVALGLQLHVGNT